MKKVYIKPPVIVLYVEGTRTMPRYWHKTMETAITEASRLSEIRNLNVHFIEYGKVPIVLGYMDTDGVMHKAAQ